MGHDLKRLVQQLRRYLTDKCPECGQQWAITWHWSSRPGEKAEGYFCMACSCGHEERTKPIDLTSPDLQARARAHGNDWRPRAIGHFRVVEETAWPECG